MNPLVDNDGIKLIIGTIMYNDEEEAIPNDDDIIMAVRKTIDPDETGDISFDKVDVTVITEPNNCNNDVEKWIRSLLPGDGLNHYRDNKLFINRKKARPLHKGQLFYAMGNFMKNKDDNEHANYYYKLAKENGFDNS